MRTNTVLLAAVLAAAAATAWAQDPPQAAAGRPHDPKHPVTALVLSGGGARGAAHIGVLRVLEELHIVPDMIIGTSMGSIVGGLYATGWTPDQIEELLQSIDWNNEIFSDRVDRTDRTFRRKQDDSILMVQGRVRFKGIKPTIPGGVLGGQRLELFLQGLETTSTGETDFDAFPIPYRAVAMDINDGAAYVFKSGSMATAMRASMSIPGMFAPVEIDGMKLVDGGAVANLPGRIARSLGADRLIAIDISSDYGSSEDKDLSFLSTISKLNSLLIFSNRVEDVKQLQPGDVYIRPDLTGISFMAFDRAADAVDKGEVAARAQIDELRAFASDAATWSAFKARHHRRPAGELHVDEVRIDNSSRLSEATVRSLLNLPGNQPFEQKGISAAVMRLKSMECFGMIRERFERADGRGVLTLSTPPRPGSRGSLQVGLALLGDTQGSQEFNLIFRHQLLGLNRHAGEVQTILQLGQSMRASVEYYQPIDTALRWFVAPSVEGSRRNRQLWADGKAVSDYRMRHDQVTVAAGRVFGSWGEVRLGAYTGNESETRTMGTVGPAEGDEARGGFLARFSVDTLDHAVFPRHGTFVNLSFDQSSSTLRADTDYQRAVLTADHSFSWGPNTLQPRIMIGANLDTGVSLANSFTLGGMGRLSGLGWDELIGEDAGVAGLIYYRRMAHLDIAALQIRMFVGGTVEAGNVYDSGDPITVDSLRISSSVFVGGDTPIGPVFLGWGLSEGGRDRFYFMLGQRF
ncbi:MAG: patatin-like phospholipase family protein [Thermoanaerobaculaceae bacterium]|jgi:NTE family protein|nr:patatin-like phospholipase family protein [Thermoanaerobaculaceae bacterium]